MIDEDEGAYRANTQPKPPFLTEIEEQKRKALTAVEGFQIDQKIIFQLNKILNELFPQLIPVVREAVIEELKKDPVPIFWSTRGPDANR